MFYTRLVWRLVLISPNCWFLNVDYYRKCSNSVSLWPTLGMNVRGRINLSEDTLRSWKSNFIFFKFLTVYQRNWIQRCVPDRSVFSFLPQLRRTGLNDSHMPSWPCCSHCAYIQLGIISTTEQLPRNA